MDFGWTSREKKLAGLCALAFLLLLSMIIYSYLFPADETPPPFPPYPSNPPQTSPHDGKKEEASVKKRIWIDVKGAVARQGVYELPEEARLFDAIKMAGGLLPEAESQAVNLAKPLADGEMIYIPKKGEKAPVPPSLPSSQPAQAAEGGKVRINTASKEELTQLPGIGDTKAKAIVDYREKNGPFQTKEGLLEVTGIGEKTFERLKDFILLP